MTKEIVTSAVDPRVLIDSARKALRLGVLDLGASMALAMIIGFAQNLVLARILGAQGLGHMAIIYSVMNVATLLGTAGLTSSILRYGAAAPEPASARAVYRKGTSLALACSVGAALVTAAFARSPLWVFDPVAGRWMPLVALILPALTLAACSTHYLQSRDRMREKAVLELGQRIFIVGGAVTGALVGGFPGCVLGYVLGAGTGGLAVFVRTWRQRIAAGPASAPVPGRELLRFGSWGLVTNMLGLGQATADIFCVSALVGDAASVGIYSLASVLQQVVAIPMRAYLDARFPEMTRASADPGALRALWRRMRRHLAVVSLLGATAVALPAPFLLPRLFGAEFAASAAPLWLLLAGQVAWSWGAAAGRALFAAGRVEGNFYVAAVAAVGNIVLNLVLIPYLGILGAAVATATTQLGWALGVTIVCRWGEEDAGSTP